MRVSADHPDLSLGPYYFAFRFWGSISALDAFEAKLDNLDPDLWVEEDEIDEALATRRTEMGELEGELSMEACLIFFFSNTAFVVERESAALTVKFSSTRLHTGLTELIAAVESHLQMSLTVRIN